MSKKVSLIAGSTGFLGSKILNYLQKKTKKFIPFQEEKIKLIQ